MWPRRKCGVEGQKGRIYWGFRIFHATFYFDCGNRHRPRSGTGHDVSGYQHLIDRDALIHIQRQHGVGNEDQAGHEPVTADDIERIPEIVAKPDSVEDGGKSGRGLQTVKYSKRFNATTYFVEEEWAKEKVLAAKTMWKVKR